MIDLGVKILAHLKEADNLVQGRPQAPVTCEIDPSNYCQNNCSWCIYSEYIKQNRIHLDFEIYRRALNSLSQSGCKAITFTGGGEPLMHPRIKEMILLAKRQGFQIGLITNGIKLDHIIDMLHLFQFVRISVDAVNSIMYKQIKQTNYFTRVCNNIQAATKKGVTDIGISMVFEKGYEKYSNEFIALGEKLGVNYAQVKPAVSENVEKISNNLLKQGGQGFVTKRFLVDKGDMLPCKLAGLIGQVAADGCFYYCCIHRGTEKYKIGDFGSKQSLMDMLNCRANFIPDLNDCDCCRYINYAYSYKLVSSEKFRALRHTNFL